MQLLKSFSKRSYTPFITPLEGCQNLRAELGDKCPSLLIKRDDQLGLAMGGNKTRKLEYLMADALAKGATTIIACGAVQSNHCRLTLAAAKKEGLECQLVLQERAPGTFKEAGTGNNLLYHLLGVDHKVVISNDQDPVKEMEKLAQKCQEEGKEPYMVPGGGSNEIGALGYVECLYEIKNQVDELGLTDVALVVPSGSSGTHAGVVAGAKSIGWDLPIVGISVMRNKADQTEKVLSLAQKVMQTLGSDAQISQDDIVVFDEYVGDGYAISTQEMIDATKLLARTEGILVDPVYTGKAFAGTIDRIKQGDFSGKQAVIFLQTGGSPAIFAYQDDYALDYSFSDNR